ncbi:hypothetical protein [Paraburkholderia sp. 35.1]|uniref:hypothetical protein n=1 Tax=Paraburkholderia sp. 35.1 TaxID=2991058 RepID=UPI003D214010
MLTTPVFRPWRPIWDVTLSNKTQGLDELAQRRNKGRHIPPPVGDPEDAWRIVKALRLGSGAESSFDFLNRKVKPLLKACVWPRWLLLESALDHAAIAGDLSLSAIVLRTQIEELDVLKVATTILSHQRDDTWDDDAMAFAIDVLLDRVLPRLQTKTAEDLRLRASDSRLARNRFEPLQQAYDQLSEFVHPNYGSHVLSIRPYTVEVAEVFSTAFVTVYEAFLSLPWANEKGTHRESKALQSPAPQPSVNPFLVLTDKTAPGLESSSFLANAERWSKAVEVFTQCAQSEESWDFSDDQLSNNVEAIAALTTHGILFDDGPKAFTSTSKRNRYAFLVTQEHQLATDASQLPIETRPDTDGERLPLLVSALSFSISLAEYKLDSLARHAAHLLNDTNVLGAALSVRSMLEHHAIAIALGNKLQELWAHAEQHAPNEPKVNATFKEAEKQVARVLAGSSNSSGVSSAWRELWHETVRGPYNVLEPIKKMDEVEPGFLQTYDFLSHLTHGSVGTGGDLLGLGGATWKTGHQTLAAQVTLILSDLCGFDRMMDRHARTMAAAHRLHVVQGSSEKPGERIKTMRLQPKQMLKQGRDIFGSGTEEDPFRFRDGLLYHSAYRHYLEQEMISVAKRELARLGQGIGDRVEAEDGRTLFFLDRQ